MAEAEDEATYVWSHKARIALFFSAMRHYRDEARTMGRRVHYQALSSKQADDHGRTLGERLTLEVRRLRPDELCVVEPGDYRVRESLMQTARALDVALNIVEDRHFYCSISDFRIYADNHPGLLLEAFYRWMRKRHEILLTQTGEPEGGKWNYDAQNRDSFKRHGPPDGARRPPLRFAHDAVDREVIATVKSRFAAHPGELTQFEVPRTRAQARAALRDFIRFRLGGFGRYEDAMWAGETTLFHSRLSSALNLKLLDPRECVRAAVRAYCATRAPIASVEAFVRQIVGWRELVRGVYWLKMPAYASGNALGCDPNTKVPRFFWDAETDMRCVADCARSTLKHGYAHHIQRLMVLGLFAQLAGVHPYAFHEWHMAMYLDAVDWVSLPNALGMSQYGDGGVVGTKPYIASGNYINKMSNYCERCPYDYKRASGDAACPFTTLYWDFLERHRDLVMRSGRLALQLRNLERKSSSERRAIAQRARELRAHLGAGGRI